MLLAMNIMLMITYHGLHYHALQCTEPAGMNSVNALLSLFHESENTVAMIWHLPNAINQASSSAHKPRPYHSCNS